jgi:hypothetical protein
VIALAVRWYLRFGLAYRDVEEFLAERGSRSTMSRYAGGFSGSGRWLRPPALPARLLITHVAVECGLWAATNSPRPPPRDVNGAHAATVPSTTRDALRHYQPAVVSGN